MTNAEFLKSIMESEPRSADDAQAKEFLTQMQPTVEFIEKSKKNESGFLLFALSLASMIVSAISSSFVRSIYARTEFEKAQGATAEVNLARAIGHPMDR